MQSQVSLKVEEGSRRKGHNYEKHISWAILALKWEEGDDEPRKVNSL